MLLNVLLLQVTVILVLNILTVHGTHKLKTKSYIFKTLNDAKLVNYDTRSKRESNEENAEYRNSVISNDNKILALNNNLKPNHMEFLNTVIGRPINANDLFMDNSLKSLRNPVEILSGTGELGTRQQLHQVIEQLYQAQAQVEMEADEIQRYQEVAAEAEQALEEATNHVQSINTELQIAQEAVATAGMEAHSAQMQLSEHDQLLFTARQKVDSLSAQMVGLQAQLGLCLQKISTEPTKLLPKMQQRMNTFAYQNYQQSIEQTELPPSLVRLPPINSNIQASSVHQTPRTTLSTTANVPVEKSLINGDIYSTYLSLINALQKAKQVEKLVQSSLYPVPSSGDQLFLSTADPNLYTGSSKNQKTFPLKQFSHTTPVFYSLPSPVENSLQEQQELLDNLAEANTLPEIDKKLLEQGF